jgi:hypothetical protein
MSELDLSLKNISKNAIDKISNMELLDEEDKVVFNEISNEIKEAWDKKQIWRTDFEIEYGVLNSVDFPTPDSRYWQCLKEMDAVFDQMMQTYYKFKEKQIEFKILDVHIKKNTDMLKEIEDENDKELFELKVEQLQNKKDKISYSLLNLKQQVKDRVREMKQWSKMIKKHGGEVKYDTDNPNSHKLIFFIHKMYYKLMDAAKENNNKMIMDLKYRLYDLIKLAKDTIKNYDEFAYDDPVLSLIELTDDDKMIFKRDRDEQVNTDELKKIG